MRCNFKNYNNICQQFWRKDRGFRCESAFHNGELPRESLGSITQSFPVRLLVRSTWDLMYLSERARCAIFTIGVPQFSTCHSIQEQWFAIIRGLKYVKTGNQYIASSVTGIQHLDITSCSSNPWKNKL